MVRTSATYWASFPSLMPRLAALSPSRSLSSRLASPTAVHAPDHAFSMMVDSEVQLCQESTVFMASSHPHCPPFHTRQVSWSEGYSERWKKFSPASVDEVWL